MPKNLVELEALFVLIAFWMFGSLPFKSTLDLEVVSVLDGKTGAAYAGIPSTGSKKESMRKRSALSSLDTEAAAFQAS
jgi:hypothetical protein